MATAKATLATYNNVERYFMARRKTNIEEKELEKQLTEVEPTVELLKQLVKQNEQIIQLLTKLKDRFV